MPWNKRITNQFKTSIILIIFNFITLIINYIFLTTITNIHQPPTKFPP